MKANTLAKRADKFMRSIGVNAKRAQVKNEQLIHIACFDDIRTVERKFLDIGAINTGTFGRTSRTVNMQLPNGANVVLSTNSFLTPGCKQEGNISTECHLHNVHAPKIIKIRVSDRNGKYASKIYSVEAEDVILAYGEATSQFIKDNNHPKFSGGRISSYYARFWNEVVK